jgi:hypothetical protein
MFSSTLSLKVASIKISATGRSTTWQEKEGAKRKTSLPSFPTPNRPILIIIDKTLQREEAKTQALILCFSVHSEVLMQTWIRQLEKLELLLTLPVPILEAFETAQAALNIPNSQKEKMILFLPLLTFPIVDFASGALSILFYFLILLLTPKKSHATFLVEIALLISYATIYPAYAPFAYIFMVSSWILMHTPMLTPISHPAHRFFWVAPFLVYPPLLQVLAPVLGCISLGVGIRKKFFVWAENKLGEQ